MTGLYQPAPAAGAVAGFEAGVFLGDLGPGEIVRRFPWGMTGERFRDLVRYALLELGLRLAPIPAAEVEH